MARGLKALVVQRCALQHANFYVFARLALRSFRVVGDAGEYNVFIETRKKEQFLYLQDYNSLTPLGPLHLPTLRLGG
jgi:hypothetical protein